MPPRLANRIRVEEVLVGAVTQIEELLLDRSWVIHPPTFSMSAARGIR